jgi:hypothetical protein
MNRTDDGADGWKGGPPPPPPPPPDGQNQGYYISREREREIYIYIYILHIVKDIVVIFREAFSSRDPSIHPWMASYREENHGRTNIPPLCACV